MEVEGDFYHHKKLKHMKELGSTEPLLSSDNFSDQQAFQDIDDGQPKITLFRSVAVLTNIITGVGLLGIPYCFCSGLGTNLIVILLIAALSCFSFSILIDCAVSTGIIDYPRLINIAFPKHKLQWIPDLQVVLLFFGGAILYLQFSSSMIISIFNGLRIDFNLNIPDFLTNRWFIVFVIQFVIDFPLVLLKSMSALSFVSLLSVVLIACYIAHSIYYFAKGIHDEGFDPDNKLVVFGFDLKHILPSLAVQATSYTCHPSIFPTLVKLERPTKFRLNLVMILVTLAASVLYLVGGIIPYLTLFSDILDPVVLNYYKNTLFTTVIKACYSVILILTAPMLIFTCRLSFHNLIFKSPMNTLKHNLLGISILILAALIAVTVTKVSLVYSILGGICAPLLVYIFPSLYFLRICKDGSKVKKIFSIVSLVVGILFIPVCLYDAIKSIISSIKE
ncbi:Transmembrane amino acid transporter protein [Tritrichomonas foetus]|uniref:Transmembrane amino acid transporter protein n=1 Tax=Tritrichomonas foetus TaxID=1144522 RepID=A0A1J4KU10_9EUKA|nr:Transmembrane amino acid transporter protein [Tritrichomonas foetus]|eukprot:OHT12973.1 Transmembrane amino acid transporter protein [Tritrichomonas foetus]